MKCHLEKKFHALDYFKGIFKDHRMIESAMTARSGNLFTNIGDFLIVKLPLNRHLATTMHQESFIGPYGTFRDNCPAAA